MDIVAHYDILFDISDPDFSLAAAALRRQSQITQVEQRMTSVITQKKNDIWEVREHVDSFLLGAAPEIQDHPEYDAMITHWLFNTARIPPLIPAGVFEKLRKFLARRSPVSAMHQLRAPRLVQIGDCPAK